MRIIITTECILRDANRRCRFVGPEGHHLFAIVARVDAAVASGHAPDESDLVAIDHLPVLDAPEESEEKQDIILA